MVETRTDKIVVRSKLPTPLASAEAFGAGTARALQRAGTMGVNVSDRAFRENEQQKKEEDYQKQKDAVNKGMQFETSFEELRREKVNSGALTKRGQAALGVTAAWEKEAEEWYNQAKEQVTNDYELKVLDNIYNRHNNATLDTLTRFEAQEKERYYEENTTNRLKSALDDALANYQNEQMVAQAYNSGLAALRVNYADRPDLLSVKEKAYKSDFYKTQTLRRADDDANEAAAYYQQHKAQIVGSEQQAIEKLISDRKQFQAELPYKLAEKQLKAADMQIKINQYQSQIDFDNQTAGMDDSGKLRYLQENEAQYSSNWFKAKQKALLSEKGITAETRAETAQELLLDLTELGSFSTDEYLRGADKLLAKIENKYAGGEISLNDKKRLTNNLYKVRENELVGLGEKNGWFEFSYKDAQDKINDNASVKLYSSKIMLDYFRAIDGKELDDDDKKAVLNRIIKIYNDKALTEAVLGKPMENKQANKTKLVKTIGKYKVEVE